MTSSVPENAPSPFLPEAPWLRRCAVRSPTLPPATHTNVYVVGTAATGLAVIDPASPYPEEQAALDAFLDALGIPVIAVLLTHHHVDHVSGAGHLAARRHAPVLAHRATAERLAEQAGTEALRVDRFLDDGELLPCGPAGLRAVYTPGHAPGHLAFRDEATGIVIAGDMVASVGTIIVSPPHGVMQLYLDSLERLRRLAPPVLLPAHGEPIRDPERLLAFYVAHRLEREQRVVAALQAGAGSLDALVPRVYRDVSPELYPLAARSLLAHLIKLRDEGRAEERDEIWSA